MINKKAYRNSILTKENRDAISKSSNAHKTPIAELTSNAQAIYVQLQKYISSYVESTVEMHTQAKLEALPLGNPVMDAAGLRPNACHAKYSGVAAALHFAANVLVGCTSPSNVSAPARRTEGAPPRVEQVAAAVAERAPLAAAADLMGSADLVVGSGGDAGRPWRRRWCWRRRWWRRR
jgi:hypothetical protein